MRENMTQQSIFYYNNDVLNQVVNGIAKRAPQHTNPLTRDDNP
jgi:hypothetical protein